MSKIAGLLMIVAGVGTAAYIYPMVGSPDNAERQLADVAAITTAATVDPKKATAAPASQPAVQAPPRVISADTQPGRPQLMPAPSAPVPPAVVAQAAPAAAPAPVAQAKPLEPPLPQLVRRKSDDDAKTTLARDIQRELKRVGCYQGDADGTWNTGTRQAMKSFIDRVNATLPTDEPDHILKTLVQGHPGNACGKACPAGQSASMDGKCLPTAIMTQGPTPAKRPIETASVPQPAPSAPAPAATPQPNSVPPPQAASRASAPSPTEPAASSWETTTTATAPAMAAVAAAAAMTASEPKRSSEVLPGRMAVGAPQPQNDTPVQPPVTAFKPETSKPRLVAKPQDSSERAARSEPVETEKPASRPSVGAVTAAQRASPPPAAAPRGAAAAYRTPPPPPRYVGAYSPPAVARPRFGPQIFRQLEQSGR